MSSIGQVVGGVVGAFVGFFASGMNPMGAVQGAALGMSIGGYIDPPKGPMIHGPRLSDLSVQTSTYGANVPRVYGTIATHGNIFWLEGDKLKETATKEEQGGKGGGGATVTTYTYSATFALGLCAGPIVGIRRIWIGSKLWYDAGATNIDSAIASNKKAEQFRLYTGTETQAPDPRMQADKGIANTPAYRGLAYIVFYDLPLQDYGNTLLGAQVKVEIATDATTSNVVYEIHDTPATTQVAITNIGYDSGRYWAHNGSASPYYTMTSFNGKDWSINTTPGNLTTHWNSMVYASGRWVSMYGGSGQRISYDGLYFESGTGDLPPGGRYVGVVFGGVFYAMNTTGYYCTSSDGLSWSAEYDMPTAELVAAAVGESALVVVCEAGKILRMTGFSWASQTPAGTSDWRCLAYGNGVFMAGRFEGIGISEDDGASWSVFTHAGKSFDDVAFDGVRFAFVRNDSGTIYFTTDGQTVDAHAITLPAGYYFRRITASDGAFVIIATRLAGGVKAIRIVYANLVTSGTITLAEIVEAECAASGLLEPADIDAAALVSQVRGYRVAQVGAIRGAIEPLQASWPFDAVQSGYQIEFKPRAGGAVAVIDAMLLDARAGSDAPGVSIASSREMDTQLPRRVSLKHIDAGREYDNGEQFAERLSTDAINVRELELPIVLTADEAAQKAEVLLYLYWLERNDVSLRLPPVYLGLEPADVITAVTDDASYELRLIEINYLPDGRLECRARYNSAAIYTSTAVGSAGTAQEQTLADPGISVFQVLDLPALTSSMDRPCVLGAMTGPSSAWPGGVLFRSADGQQWTSVQGWTNTCTMGRTRTSIASASSTLVDAASVLTVDLISGTLSSISELAMLAGGNHFAYGADGRWEIIAARTCELQSDGSYRLRDMLRGRFGTLHNRGNHAAGDWLILLTDPDVAFISMDLQSIGLDRLYRGITAGDAIDSQFPTTFRFNAVSLKPLAPSNALGTRHPTTRDWTLAWFRHTRIGWEWRDSVDALLGEATSSFEVDIFTNSSYSTLKRTIAATLSSVSYTSAQQVADFGSNQGTIYFRIYQLSATVGRGYPLEGSITLA